MSSDAVNQLDTLRRRVRDYGSVLVAYSGGVDSALVAAVAHEQLGRRALACIAASYSYPQRELRQALAVAEKAGFACRVVDTREHLDARYAANSSDRCFFCKSHLFETLRDIAQSGGWQAIADGVHTDDVADHRYGIAAAHENGVRSPLMEAGLGKQAVRELARLMGLPVWDKPAAPCLASRVPQGTAITPQLLRQIERAEDVLAAMGFRCFRVRHHGELARIELATDELPRAVQFRQTIIAGILDAGYRFVTLDLAGFRGAASPHRPELIPLGVHRC